jgi:hypothetical protein
MTHAADDVQVVDVHAHDLEGHPTPFVRALGYVGKAPAFNFYGVFRAVRDVHRLWDHVMSAACFAKFIEQLQSFPIRHRLILKTLQFTLALGWEEGMKRRGDVLYPFH